MSWGAGSTVLYMGVMSLGVRGAHPPLYANECGFSRHYICLLPAGVPLINASDNASDDLRMRSVDYL